MEIDFGDLNSFLAVARAKGFRDGARASGGSASGLRRGPEMCRANLEVKLTPDVPNPRDPSFLSALAANPLYQPTWIRGTDTTAGYELRGPSTDYQCEDEIKRLRRDAHVMDLEVHHPHG